jgi:putative GTP pyrophosphokinase
VPNELAAAYEGRRELLTALCMNVAELIQTGLLTFPHREHIDHVSFRVKGLRSFVGKAEKKASEYHNPLVEIEDQVAGRVVVVFRHDVPLVLSLLQESAVTPVQRQRKGPRNYDDFGYDDEHLSFAIPLTCEPQGWADLESRPQVIELQVRTIFQHAWAQAAHLLDYKPEGGTLDDPQRRRLAHVAASAWGADREIQLLHEEVAVNDTDR